MTFLPIQFTTKFPKHKLGKLNSKVILDEIERWLIVERFNYVERKENKIVFHKGSLWSGLNIRSFLVSGVIKVEYKNEDVLVTNGNWMIFLIAIPFLVVIASASSRYSSFEKKEIEIIWIAFLWLFGVNFFVRLYAHWSFNKRIKRMIEEIVKYY